MAMSSDEVYYDNEKQFKDRKGKRETCHLNRHCRDRFQERMDFKFYDFQAFEVENGWNKLFVSIISMETGKTIAKSGKALVQNGQCQWEDSMFSTIWISDDSLKENEGFLLKLVISMGSARFGTLGEATINLASYIRPETSTASLPLKQHCSHGTILQVKIQCLAPRIKTRRDANSYLEEVSVGYDNIDCISDASDNTFSRTSRSSHCDRLETRYYRGEPSNKKISPLATFSDHDVDSLESSFSFWIEKFPQQSNVSGLKNNLNLRKDSTYSTNGPYLYDTSRSIYSSSTRVTSSLGAQLQDKIEDFEKVSHASDSTLTRSVSSSKDLLGAAQVTIELLHGEGKLWEENARKLMIDVENLRKELKKKSKNKKDLEMELLASREENDGFKEEIHRLTTMVKQNNSRNLEFQIEEMDNIIKELKDEIKYQKGLNSGLELKLKKTQESNIDLVSNLRKLEKTIEKQKMEIADLSMTSLQFQDAENNSHGLEDSEEEDFSLSKESLPEKMRKEFCHSGVDLSTNENAIRCLHEGIELQEFWNLELEHQLMQEKQKNMESTIQFLQKTMDEKEKQISNFEKKLSDGVYAFGNEILALKQRLLETKATSFEYEINSHDELVRKRIRDDNELQNEIRDCSLNENIFCISSQELRNIHGQLVSEFIQLTENQMTLVNKDDVKNLSELESSDDEQNALFELEAENVPLSEQIVCLEAEIRNLIEEKESTHLTLENSETVVINLQAEIRRMETKNEAQIADMKRKEESMQKKWLEAQEECSFMKVANLELQGTNEKLIKESETLQTTNVELRMQNLELHNQCTKLKSKLGESQIAFSGMLKQVEDLEYKFTSMLEEIALKEKTINVDLDALLQESKKQDERYNMEERYLTQMYLEKTAEVGNLLSEVEYLRHQMSGIYDRHKRIASNIVLEVYDLCADKAMLEAALQEEQEKVQLHETKLDNIAAEYEVMVQNYTEELAATRANQETLMVNHEKVVVLLENVKSNEEKLKNIVTGLEAELKASELERLQATEEISELEVQLQKTEMLQDELFVLKRSLYEAEYEYRRLEASYEMLSLEYEELKAKKISYIRRISTIEKVTAELEDCKHSKVELEEKILRLEWNLTTKEASTRNKALLKYELAQMTRANGELLREKDAIQEENEECQKKLKDLEEKLKQEKDVTQDQHNAKDCSTSTTSQDDLKLLQKEDSCSSIKSNDRPFLLPHPYNVTHNKLLTEQCPKLEFSSHRNLFHVYETAILLVS
ncbi:uncharacterized protein LOC133307309 [Gastrolobium bilobum]|uniref:uncharacterized protein LOC133307309 n=1 Tax=Gastrolobium bilobum TaxID=150636 RepID=UPI002AAFFECC|nr:uncharacterized protein LOC133307309 [Gastrolobium bilobum]